MNKIRILCACDLDGTLLTSARSASVKDIPVEHVHDRDISYLTPGTIKRLRELPDDVLLIPVTSRSIAQYKRIQWPEGVKFEYAMAANGCICLHGSQIKRRITWPLQQAPWYYAFRDLLAGKYSGICRVVDDSYVYLHGDDRPSQDDLDLAAKLGLSVFQTGKKFYLLPAGADKSDALLWLIDRIKPETVIAAGDGAMDLGMLDIAGHGLVPSNGINGQVSPGWSVCPPGTPFSEYILDYITKLAGKS